MKSRVVSTGTQEKARVQESVPAVSITSASSLFLSPELKKLLVKQKKRINQSTCSSQRAVGCQRLPGGPSQGRTRRRAQWACREEEEELRAAKQPGSRAGRVMSQSVFVSRVQKHVSIKEALTRAQQYVSVPLRHTAVICLLTLAPCCRNGGSLCCNLLLLCSR